MSTVTVGKFPASIAPTNSTDVKLYDLSLSINNEGLLEVVDPPSLDEVYNTAHNDSPGERWSSTNNYFYDYFMQYDFKNVLEIGGGFISKYAQRALEERDLDSWINIDPNALPCKQGKFTQIDDFYSASYTSNADIILHSNLIEHVIDQDTFIQSLALTNKVGTRHIFMYPDFRSNMELPSTSFLNFEHTKYLPVNYLVHLLTKHNFKINKVQYKDGFVVLIDTTLDENVETLPFKIDPNLMEKYIAYIATLTRRVDTLNKKIAFYSDTRTIYYFGAHIFYLMDVACGLDTTHVIALLDNSTIKQGKYMSGTTLKIKSPDTLRNSLFKNAVIVNSGYYQKEMVQQIKELGAEVIEC